MSVIGVDHGTKRCGIAIEIAGVAFPKDIVPTGLVLHALHKLVAEYGTKLIVIGKAPHLDGKRSRQQGIQEDFVTVLGREFPECQIVMSPEGFSSKQARYELEAAGLPSDGQIDDQAAAIILQDYLDKN
jgi:RNase H-fold protein (predicted Holliday junction resolvase)